MNFPDYIITPRGDGSFIARPVIKTMVKEVSEPETSGVTTKNETASRETVVSKKPSNWTGTSLEMLKRRAREMKAEAEHKKDIEDIDLLYDDVPFPSDVPELKPF